MGRLFGTDGVRGIANKELTPELAFNLGKAGAYVLAKENKKPVVISEEIREFRAICLKMLFQQGFSQWAAML